MNTETIKPTKPTRTKTGIQKAHELAIRDLLALGREQVETVNFKGRLGDYGLVLRQSGHDVACECAYYNIDGSLFTGQSSILTQAEALAVLACWVEPTGELFATLDQDLRHKISILIP